MSKRKPRASAVGSPAHAEPGGSSLAPGERFRPWLLAAICALLVARPLYPSEAAISRGDSLPVVMLWIALAVLWSLTAIGHPRFRLRFGWVDGLVLLVVVLHAISGMWAMLHVSPRPAINALWEWIGYGLCFFLARQSVLGKRETRAVLAVMVGVGVLLATYGLFQYFHEMPKIRIEYRANPDATLRNAGLSYPPGSTERQQFEQRLESVEPLSTFALTNSLAGYLAPWFIIVIGIATARTARRNAESEETLIPMARTWLGMGVAASLMGLCLLLTKSRSGYIAALIGVGLLAFAGRRVSRVGKRALVAAAAIVVLFLGIGIAAGGLDREILTQATKSLGYRLQYWQSSLQMIVDHPWTGCGLGNFQESYPAYKLPTASEEVSDPHNFLLEVGATAGTPAMLAFSGMLLVFFWINVRGRPEESSESPNDGVSTNGTVDRAIFAYGGGLAGLVLGAGLGLMSENMPSVFTFLFGAPAAIIVVALLSRWIEEGGQPPRLPLIGIVVLLVNLSAAGSLGFPGVAITLWLLMAIGVNEAEASGDQSDGRQSPRYVHVGALSLGLGLAVLCHFSAYGPVLASRRAMQLAMEQKHPRQQEQFLRAAAKADPWAAEPWLRLAQSAIAQWTPTMGQSDALARFDEAAGHAMRLVPNSAPTWFAVGQSYYDLSQKVDHRDFLKKAVNALRRAVELYPSNPTYQGKLAIALRESGDENGFREHGANALWLDEVTPHSDKKIRDPKLRDELRTSLERTSFGRN